MFSLALFAPENLVSRDRFGLPVPRQPAHPLTSGLNQIYLVLSHVKCNVLTWVLVPTRGVSRLAGGGEFLAYPKQIGVFENDVAKDEHGLVLSVLTVFFCGDFVPVGGDDPQAIRLDARHSQRRHGRQRRPVLISARGNLALNYTYLHCLFKSRVLHTRTNASQPSSLRYGPR